MIGIVAGFLAFVALTEQVRVWELRGWAYCLHTQKALRDETGQFGCIARARARTRCPSLLCPLHSRQYWCKCFNMTCAAYRTGRQLVVRHLSPGRTASGGIRFDGVAQRLGSHWHESCIDMLPTGKQMLHSVACPLRQLAHGFTPCAACPWPRDPLTRLYTAANYSDLEC